MAGCGGNTDALDNIGYSVLVPHGAWVVVYSRIHEFHTTVVHYQYHMLQ